MTHTAERIAARVASHKITKARTAVASKYAADEVSAMLEIANSAITEMVQPYELAYAVVEEILARWERRALAK